MAALALSHINTVLFDLDGTLIDSVPHISAILQSMRADRSLPIAATAEIRYWSSRGGLPMIKAILGCADHEAETLLNEFRTLYVRHPTDQGCLYPGARETLEWLQRCGYTLTLCTNKPSRLTFKIMEELSIGDFFKAIICGDTLAVKKPDPAPLHEALRLVGAVAERALMIGDSTIDQRAAQAAGVKFGFFADGYDDGVDIDLATVSLQRLTELTFLLEETPQSALQL